MLRAHFQAKQNVPLRIGDISASVSTICGEKEPGHQAGFLLSLEHDAEKPEPVFGIMLQPCDVRRIQTSDEIAL